MNDNRRIYTNKRYDITIIEKKPKKDNIYNFMEIDENIFVEGSSILYDKSTAYIIQFPFSGKASVSYGIIHSINEYNIYHYCCTDYGSSGSPIMNLENKIIGIHIGASRFNINCGTYLKYPIKEFLIKYKIIKNNENEINGNIKINNKIETIEKEKNNF